MIRGQVALHPSGHFHQPRGIRPPDWIIGDQTCEHRSQQYHGELSGTSMREI